MMDDLELQKLFVSACKHSRDPIKCFYLGDYPQVGRELRGTLKMRRHSLESSRIREGKDAEGRVTKVGLCLLPVWNWTEWWYTTESQTVPGVALLDDSRSESRW
jgi:hypothetical protein